MEKITLFLNENSITLHEFISLSFPCVKFILNQNVRETENKTDFSEILTTQLKIQENISEIREKFLIDKNQKGKKTEKDYLLLLSKALKNYEITDVSESPGNCDIKISGSLKPEILIEVKEYTLNVPGIQVKKFINDIKNYKKHGIFISNHSGIAMKKDWDFEIISKKYVAIYLSDVNFDIPKILSAIQLIYLFHDSFLNKSESKKELSESEYKLIIQSISLIENNLKEQKEILLKSKQDIEKMLKLLENNYLNNLKEIFSLDYSKKDSSKVKCIFCLSLVNSSNSSKSSHKNKKCIYFEKTKNLKQSEVFEIN